MKTIWLSYDIEATGPVPGLHSMISIGIVAYGDDGNSIGELGRFEANLRELDHCTWDPDTHGWWHQPEQAGALSVTLADPQDPRHAMHDIVDFLYEMQKDWPDAEQTWAAWPATFDMPFVRYYMQLLAKEAWLDLYADKRLMSRIAGFDMGSYASALLDIPLHKLSTSKMPDSWKGPPNPLPHVAINDAEEQGHLLLGMVGEARRRRK